jgi:acyl dehydratase
MSSWRRDAAEGRLEVGTTIRFSRTFAQGDVDRFGEITRDANPVHSDRRWCDLKGFGGPICHGLLIGSMVCEPGGQWGWLASGMSFRFARPVYIGDTVTCEMTIVELDERRYARAEATLTNHRGEVVLTAELKGYLPGAPERAVLADLVAGRE